jgi:hypothetical protein
MSESLEGARLEIVGMAQRLRLKPYRGFALNDQGIAELVERFNTGLSPTWHGA